MRVPATAPGAAEAFSGRSRPTGLKVFREGIKLVLVEETQVGSRGKVSTCRVPPTPAGSTGGIHSDEVGSCKGEGRRIRGSGAKGRLIDIPVLRP